MVYGDAGLQETANIEQRTVISKMHNMQWLKNSSQLFGHTKAFPHEKENKTESLKEDIDQVVDGSINILPSTSSINHPNPEQSCGSALKDNTEKGDPATGKESELSLSVSVIQNTMEAVWKDDGPESLRPDNQSLALERLDEEEMMSMALAESMVTAQLEHFRIDKDPTDDSEVTSEKPNTDNWDSAQKKSDIINTTPKQENPKQCHDSNNNDAKSEIISELSTDINRRQTVRDWADDEDNDIDESSATIKESCNEKHDLHDASEKNTKDVASDSVKSSLAENTKAEEVEGAKSRQSISVKTQAPSSSAAISKNNKPITNEKQTEEDNLRRCHKVQITRTQSYNNQYIRNKALARSQARYSQTMTKSDQDLSKKPPGSGSSTSSGPSNQPANQPANHPSNQPSNQSSNHPSNHPSNQPSNHPPNNMDSRQRCNPNRVPSTRDGYYRRYDQQEPKRREAEQNTGHRPTSGSYNTSGSAPMRNSTRTFEGSSSNRFERNSSYNGNRMQQNPSSGRSVPSNPKASNDRYDRDHNGGDGQRLKRDPNVYRRSTDYSSARYQHVKPKVDDHRPIQSGRNNVARHDNKEQDRDQPSNSTVSNTNRTNESSQQNIRPPESIQHVPSQREEEQFRESIDAPQISALNTQPNIKIVQDQEIGSCTNKVTPVEAKAAKFSENLQELDTGSHSMPSYINNPPPPNKQCSNPYVDGSQNVSHMTSMQQVECVQSVPVEQYYDNTVTYSHVSPINIHSSEHQQSQMQKEGQVVQTLPSACMPHMSNLAMAGGGLMHYSNPGLYMNQYNPVHNMPRKSTEITSIAQNTASTNNSVASAGNQNVMAGDSSSMMMHGSQAAAATPPGFQNHPQQEQWSIAQPEMMYFGNMMNTMHPLGMPIQNYRPPCNGDYNALQQAGYLQQPVIYMPPMCMQGWNPMMQCPGPLLQAPQYAGYNPLSHQVMSSGNLMEPVSCPVSSPVQTHQYKSYQQGEGDYRKELSPQKADACGNLLGHVSKLGNTKAKDNALDIHMRASQYYQAPNDYQNTSQDTQVMSPYTYSAPIVPPMKACPLSVHSQTYQKYPVPRNVTTANYPRYSDNQHYNNRDYARKDDMSKNDSDFIPPMISPRECMFYGGNYSRKTDYMPNSTLKSEMKH